MIEADIQILAGDWHSQLNEPEALAQRAVAAAGEAPAAPGSQRAGSTCEISIVLSDDDHVRVLNREYRGKDRATNVLAFPPGVSIPGERLLLGDVVLAFETVQREAEAQKKPFGNHMCHLIVHGTLHLLGYDHQDEREAARMEAEEAAILTRLGIPDPYATDLAEETGTASDG